MVALSFKSAKSPQILTLLRMKLTVQEKLGILDSGINSTVKEVQQVPVKYVLSVPKPEPEVVAMLTSGLTASIAFEKAADVGSGKVVLVTAAAGGTGQFAVQLAKLAGSTVVATCGDQDKAVLLKEMGVDRAIDYKTENIKAVVGLVAAVSSSVNDLKVVGLVAAVGSSVNDLKVGTPATIMTFGSYAEFMMVPVKYILPVPKPEPEVVAMLTSGLTASIAFKKAADVGSGKVVLVTAAAGGTGQFAVQLAKLAGSTVVATCGGQDKAALLKEMGVDRVIDYKTENIKAVLKKEFPKGVDVVYESVGGEMFDLCLNALAVYGRLIVIGMISQEVG